MSEPWFDPIRFGWVPGTLLGVVAGTWGGLVGVLAPRGRGKAFVLGGFAILFTVSVVLLAAGIVALVSGQPYGVWYGLGLAGVIGVLVLGGNAIWGGRQVLQYYRAAEERQMSAQDLE